MKDWSLAKNPQFSGVSGPVVVCVMDGVGLAPPGPGNAVALARTPHLDQLAASRLTTTLQAHGTAVGLPSDDDMGNSEVGHNAIGAGRVFAQGAKLVNQAIADGLLFDSEAWKQATARAAKANATLHFIGLLSDGNVHSNIKHLFAMLKHAQQQKLRQVRVHVLLDGRDVPEGSGDQYVKQLNEVLDHINSSGDFDYRIASGGGRMVTTMDRYGADWSIVKRGWEAHVHGEARKFPSALEAIATLRSEQDQVSDQMLPAFVIVDENQQPVGKIVDGDAVIMFNFRGDRAIEISRAFTEQSFSEFARGAVPDVFYAGMLQYDGDLNIPPNYLVKPPVIGRTIGEYLARNKISQLAVSETQKFGHVTYFWNGNRTEMFDPDYEEYHEVPSDVRPFEQRPWMKAAEIADVLIDQLQTGRFRHARLNFANGDMVGHTGVLEAGILAVEAVDLQIGRILAAVKRLKGALVVTADHGNVEDMFHLDKKTGQPKLNEAGQPEPKTSHSLNPVPFYVWTPQDDLRLNANVHHPGLANIAGTILYLLGFEAPDDYHASLLA